ncbi:Wzz/FepE/Etk N-terminal domain-containing protein [Planococcus faecalis]|uniref:Wzz/FepE/Etk N-terminal domain-containing protein n=1 Tax=Planococcus faecalis TaxID=1598147 RepID=UPI00210ABFC5|nr:Wzz/FepE/Etk N-terminal domain-containing protein [Planococcus faecalis]
MTVTIVAMIITALVSYYLVTPIYQTSTQLLISQQRGEVVVDSQSIEADLQLVATYSEIIKSPVILEQVISQLD